MNSTVYSNRLLATVQTVQLVSAIYLAILGIVQVISNALLLFTIYRDPFKTLRLPATLFIASLSLADLLTGFLANSLISWYLLSKIYALKFNEVMVQVGDVVSGITVTVSNATVLAISWVQLISITYPYKYRKIVTSKSIGISVICIWLYALIFSLLQLTSVQHVAVRLADLFINYTALLVAFMVTYVLLYLRFRRQIYLTRSNGVLGMNSAKFQRTFYIANLILLSLHLGCTIPHSVDLYFTFYGDLISLEERLWHSTAKLVIYDVLFLKFSLNVLVYAWRLPKYRNAFREALCNGCRIVEPTCHVTTNGPIIRYIGESVVLTSYTVWHPFASVVMDTGNHIQQIT
ncbi:melanocortin receptor 5 [Nematostella vectensis]|uniref:melanocortin receptor 5 n=1 Tax=Nematostella vectensis TaxID=45351 RepID=UPI002077157A|nr:melanocortin receptor 5 [Nematostella vectensis]